MTNTTSVTALALVGASLLLATGCAGPEIAIRSTWDEAAPTPRRIGVIPFDGPDRPSSDLISAAIGEALARKLGAPTVRIEAEGGGAERLREGMRRGQLPTRMILSTSARHGVDAVLIGRITRYRPFPPQAIGIEVALVSAVTGQVVWNAMGVVDASDPATLRAARGGAFGLLARGAPVGVLESLDDPQQAFLTLESPDAFARFVAEAFVAN